MVEYIHVKFNEGLINNRKLLDLEDDFVDMKIGPSVAPKIDKVKHFDKIPPQFGESSSQQPRTKDWKFVNYHPQYQNIGDKIEGVKTRSSFKDLECCAIVSEIKPKTIDESSSR